MLFGMFRSAVRVACAVWILATGMVACIASKEGVDHAFLVWLIVALVPVAILDLIGWIARRMRARLASRWVKPLAIIVLVFVAWPAQAQETPDYFGALVKTMEQIDQRDCGHDRLCERIRERERREKQASETAAANRIAARDASAEKAGRVPGRIWIGDTAGYVELQWGKPEQIDQVVNAGVATEFWFYPSGSVFFVDGRVQSIHTAR